MTLIPSSSVKTAFSHLAQTNYATARAAADGYRQLGETNRPMFDVKPQYTPDTENVGADESVDSFVTTNEFNESAIEQFCSFQDIGYWLHMIMGSVTKTGSVAPVTHTFTALNKAVSRQHPVRTFLQTKGSDVLMYPSVGLKELRIAKDGTGRIKVTITPHGSGLSSTNPVSYVIPAAPTDRKYLYNNQAVQTVNDTIAGTSQNYSCNTITWEWIFTNEPVGDGYTDCSPNLVANNPLAGQVRSEWFTSKYNWKFNCTVRLDSADPLRTIQQAGNLITVQTAIISPQLMTATPYSLTLSDTKAKIVDIEDTREDGGFITRSIQTELKPSRATGLMTTQAVLVNDFLSYVS